MPQHTGLVGAHERSLPTRACWGWAPSIISQTLRFLAPVKIVDTVDAILEVTKLNSECQRAELHCQCKVWETIVLQGEAVVKVPRREAGSRRGYTGGLKRPGAFARIGTLAASHQAAKVKAQATRPSTA